MAFLRYTYAALAITVGVVVNSPMSASAFGIFPSQQRAALKAELISLSEETERGMIETPEQKERIEKLFGKLEKLNPTSKPLLSDKVNGVWELRYTTSDVILGRGGSPRIGPIQQLIDTKNLRAENTEVVRYLNILDVPRKITAKLEPQSNQLTNVQFEQFSIGPVSFKAPDSFKGSLDITYVDDELRLTRGDKGNIFILTK